MILVFKLPNASNCAKTTTTTNKYDLREPIAIKCWNKNLLIGKLVDLSAAEVTAFALETLAETIDLKNSENADFQFKSIALFIRYGFAFIALIAPYYIRTFQTAIEALKYDFPSKYLE